MSETSSRRLVTSSKVMPSNLLPREGAMGVSLSSLPEDDQQERLEIVQGCRK